MQAVTASTRAKEEALLAAVQNGDHQFVHAILGLVVNVNAQLVNPRNQVAM